MKIRTPDGESSVGAPWPEVAKEKEEKIDDDDLILSGQHSAFHPHIPSLS